MCRRYWRFILILFGTGGYATRNTALHSPYNMADLADFLFHPDANGMYVWSQENDSFPEISMLPSFLDTGSAGHSDILKLGCSWTKSLSFLSLVIHNIKLYFLIITFFSYFFRVKKSFITSLDRLFFTNTVKKIVISCWWVKSSVGDQPNPSFSLKIN